MIFVLVPTDHPPWSCSLREHRATIVSSPQGDWITITPRDGVVGAELQDGDPLLMRFVVLAEGRDGDPELRSRPRTLTGKELAVPVKRVLQALAPEDAVAGGAVDHPDALARFAIRREARSFFEAHA